MRYLVLSDIHANIDALERVLEDAGSRGYDTTLLLGDLVGYGAAPGEVIARLRALPSLVAVRGNHDKAASGLDDAEGFNAVARSSAQWTSAWLSDDERGYLGRLAQGSLSVSDLVEICHGTPFDEDAYVFDEMDAVYALQASHRPICLFGHTHQPLAVSTDSRQVEFHELEAGVPLALNEARRYLINVGSVGQPRDGNPQAAYGILDIERRTVVVYRVEYPVDRAQARIREAGLPEPLAARLAAGR
jgi:predicted phosphodiesterase